MIRHLLNLFCTKLENVSTQKNSFSTTNKFMARPMYRAIAKAPRRSNKHVTRKANTEQPKFPKPANFRQICKACSCIAATGQTGKLAARLLAISWITASRVGDALLLSGEKLLELRSIRRGALQTMALAGATDQTLLEFSQHRDPQMLHRYLDWGSTRTNAAQSTMDASEPLFKAPQVFGVHNTEPRMVTIEFHRNT